MSFRCLAHELSVYPRMISATAALHWLIFFRAVLLWVGEAASGG